MAGKDAAQRRHVAISMSALAFDALMGANRDLDASLRMENALLYYLSDRESEKPAWPYPGFLRGSEVRMEVEVALEVRSGLWEDFEGEATRQGVRVEQLAEHAAFYFTAEADAGRVTQRILDDLGTGDDSEGS